MVYLDHAGATLPSPILLSDVAELLSSVQLSNPHSLHSSSRNTRQIVDNARLRVLRHFNANPKEYHVIFTYNTSHALKIVAESFEFSSKKNSNCVFVDEMKSDGPSFVYLKDSHHSIVGMRDVVKEKIDYISCLHELPDNFRPTESSLFIMSAASNFCGYKYDLSSIKKAQNAGWSVCLDAAALVGSTFLDLSTIRPHFMAFSFYKMFGYPTGLGALLVRHDAVDKLKKRNFAGGTVAAVIPTSFMVKYHPKVEERFEDGTTNFYAIAALQKCFDDLQRFGGMKAIQKHTFEVAKDAFLMLTSKMHCNGEPAAEVYSRTNFSSTRQGPIVAFNLKREDGSYTGYSEVAKMADLFGIDVRTGCFCNTGQCQNYLGLTEEILLANMEAGKRCGDEMDLIEGKPTGAVRISFGRMSTKQDVYALEQMIDYCFLQEQSTSNIEFPLSIDQYRPVLSRIRCYPIKSCRGYDVQNSLLTSTGLEMDRKFMIVANDITLSQKKYPQLCRIGVHKDFSSKNLTLVDLNDNRFELDLSQIPSTSMANIVCTNTVATVDCGDEVADWISNAMEITGCRLKATASGSEQSLANEAPYLLVNESSAQLLAKEIGIPLDSFLSRFRPNLIVRGLPPFIEDLAKSLFIDGIEFDVTGKCTRCEMICVDQITGEKDPRIIVALRNFRQRQRMTFGIYIKEVGNSSHIISTSAYVHFVAEIEE